MESRGQERVQGDVSRGQVAVDVMRDLLPLWERVHEQYTSRSDLDEMSLPEGCSADVAWTIMQMLRFGEGRRIPRLTHPSMWVCLPSESGVLMRHILEHAGSSSNLSEYLRRHSLLRVDVQSQVDELRAALAYDGFDLRYETLRALWVGERKPRDDVQRVVGNYRGLLLREEGDWRARSRRMSAIDARQAQRDASASRVGICEMHAALVAGTSLEATSPNERVQMLEANLKAARRADGPACVILSANFFEELVSTKPFACLNAVLGSLVRRALFLRMGRPALALLPLSREMLEDWPSKGGAVDPYDTRNGELSLWSADRTRFDLTPYFVEYIVRMASCLDALEALVRDDQAHDAEIRDIVANSDVLNYRQKDVLIRALDDTDATFDYASHQDRYRVVYTTARSDLMGLANRGLLRIEVLSTRNLLFHVMDDLPRLVELTLG